MVLFYAVLILFFPVLISCYVLVYRLVVKKALNKYIIPKLSENDLKFMEYRWPGLLSTGKFKDDTFQLTVMNKYGQASNSLYADIVYYTPEGQTKRVTARIDTFLFFIDKVSYSGEF